MADIEKKPDQGPASGQRAEAPSSRAEASGLRAETSGPRAEACGKARLGDKIKSLPDQPGVYLMKDDKGRVIYVGKALSLKNRVKSYFQHSKNLSPKVRALVSRIADLEYIITDSEVEALILECNLIKEHRPKYNVRLMDDKNYPYLKVTFNEKFPRVLMTRSLKKDGARYFGPFTNAGAVHETMKLLKKIFPVRSCKIRDFSGKTRPCLNFHIKQCLAPCSGQVPEEAYRAMIKEVCLFLEGRQEAIIKGLKRKMEEAAEALNFEKAAELRDQMRALEKIVEKQKMVSGGFEDQDIIALARAYGEACVQVFFIRGGKLVGREHFLLSGSEELSREEVLAAFVKQYYSQAQFIPREIILQEEMEEAGIIAEWLKEKRGGRVELRVPRRGEKLKLVEMVAKNARQVLEQLELEKLRRLDRTGEALAQLQEELGLDRLPRRMECFDISNIQGAESVGSMVVFVDGRPQKEEYRRFRIKTVEGPNDFASMEEVVGRRFKRALEETAAVERGELTPQEAKFVQLPDLVIIDGGKGQLGAARKAMEELGFGGIPTFGLAKEEEHLFAPDKREPIILPRDSQALYLVQRLRDEAHRFAITYHRSLRGKRNLHSLLEDIPGIGKARRTALLSHFKSLAAIRQATLEELASVPGMTRGAAEAVYYFFR